MKILYTNFHATDGGGHVTYILGLAKALAPHHDITVATPKSSRLYRYANAIPDITVIDQSYISRIHRMIPEVGDLRRLIAKERYDLIHINGSADHRHIMLACLGLPHRPRLLWTKHNDHPVSSFGNRIRAHWGTDEVIAVSDYVKTMLLNSPYVQRPVTTIRHGIDTDYFAPVSASEKNAARSALFGSVSDDVIVIGSSGGTNYDKGWLDLLVAVSLLPSAQRQRFRVVVAGSQPNTEKLNRVNELGVADLVVFPGLLDDVRPVLAACDIGFVLSYREALSYACREAMAMGLPALVSNVGGLLENVSHGYDGWVVPARAPEAIRDVLEQVLTSAYCIKDMGQAARKTSERDFALDPFLRQTLAVYRHVLGGSATGR